jgi:triacylglycerol esterase/lipase EstA (alpha/beta hydrolase family)
VLTPAEAAAGGVNDPSCRSTSHPVPVVLLHGLGANKDADIDQLQRQLASAGYCTFSVTYGTDSRAPFFGGVIRVAESAPQIAAFLRQVIAETGASKVDLVGHSEGGFQTLYVTKTQGVAQLVRRVVAIAPPTHGTTFGGAYALAYVGGNRRELADSLLSTGGCPACSDLGVDGKAVQVLESGPIAQPGVTYTVITSRYDEMVTPTETAFVREPGVTNLYVQDVCPADPVGHLGETYEPNVWSMVKNALDPEHAEPFTCLAGAPA